MFGRRLREELEGMKKREEEILELVRAKGSEVEVLKGVIEMLKGQNKELMDRFMTKSFGEYATFAPANTEEVEKQTWLPSEDPENAGLILGDYEDASC